MKLRTVSILLLTLACACSRKGTIMEGGVYSTRSACPTAGVPAATGDVTLFNPQGSTDASAIDVTAAISNVRAVCQDAGNDVLSTTSFTVVGLRRDAGPARQVLLPYFDVVLQGGSRVAAKRLGQVALNFPAGGVHAWTSAQAIARVSRAAATLPANVKTVLTRERKPGDEDAAVDPLNDPAIRAAVAKATFEHLVGFQLTQDQLRYNATR